MKMARVFQFVLPVFLIAAAPAGSAYADGARGVSGRGNAEAVAARGGGRATFSRGGYGRGGYAGRGGWYGGHSHSHFSGSIWIGPGWGFWDPFFYPYYYPSYPYPSYPYYRSPTVVIPKEPDEYMAPDTQEGEGGYWYFCRKPQGYYPYVERCPSGWMKVVPNATPPGEDQYDKENEQ